MPSGAAVIRYAGVRGVVWRLKFADASGRQVQETLGPESDGWNRRKAEAELRERLVRVAKKGYRRPQPITLAEYADTWLSERARKHNLKPTSVAAYRCALRHLTKALGPLPLGAIRPRHVAEYAAEALNKLSATTVNYNLSVLADVFQTALGEELVERSPVVGVDRPRAQRRKWVIWPPEAVPRVARNIGDERARLIFLAVMTTALRRGELQRLRWDDVDLVDMVLRVRESKTEQGMRAIALPAGLAEAFWQYRRRCAYQDGADLVFAHPTKGTQFWACWFAKELRAACKKAGVEPPVKPLHDLRHMAITHDAAAGAHPLAVMAKAGHTNMNTTKRYLHLAGEVFPAEAEALERRYGGTKLYRSEITSANLSAPEPLEQEGSDRA